MWPNSQFPADLVTFTEEILNEKLHFLNGEAWFVNVKLCGLIDYNLFFDVNKCKTKLSVNVNVVTTSLI